VIDDEQFVTYIQLHEFEALLFCDLLELQRRISGSDRGIEAHVRVMSHDNAID